MFPVFQIDIAEMAVVLISMGMTGLSTQEMCFLLDNVDSDKSGKISFDEFQVVAGFVQLLSEKKFEVHMMRKHLENLERKLASELAELKGEVGWKLQTATEIEKVNASIARKLQDMKSLTNDGGFGSLMANFLDKKAADKNGFESVSLLFEQIPITQPHDLRESMQKSGKVVENLPDGFMLGRVKQNKPDWAKTVSVQKPNSKTLSHLDRDLRSVFLFYCDKESHSMSFKSFLKFASDINADLPVNVTNTAMFYSGNTPAVQTNI